MQISLKVQGGDTLEWELHPEFAILDLKALVEDSTGIAVQDMRILHKGRALQDDDTLEAAGVADGTKLYVAQHSGTTAAENVSASSFVPQPGQADASAAKSASKQLSRSSSSSRRGLLEW